MLGLLSIFFVYSVAITIAVIVITIEKDKYYRKFRALEDELKRIKSTQPAAPAPPPGPRRAPPFSRSRSAAGARLEVRTGTAS